MLCVGELGVEGQIMFFFDNISSSKSAGSSTKVCLTEVAPALHGGGVGFGTYRGGVDNLPSETVGG